MAGLPAVAGMEEAVMCGVAVALLMVGVPLWHSMGECRRGHVVRVHLCRWWLLCGLMVMLSLVVAVIFGVAGFVLQNAPPPNAARLPAECKILSRNVDIRSIKVCDVDNVAHLQKSRQHSNSSRKFRCSLEYYWASVFEVDYKPLDSRSGLMANAEVPSGALPSNCRPSFASAWRTKEAYQVNRTYPCTYGSQNLKIVDITAEKSGNCSTEKEHWESRSELIKQFWYLLVYSENSLFSPSGKAGQLFSRAAAAIGLGICYSMIVTGFTRTICQLHFHFEREYSDLDVIYFEARIQLAIFFTAILFGVIWVTNYFVSDYNGVELFTRSLYKNTGLVV